MAIEDSVSLVFHSSNDVWGFLFADTLIQTIYHQPLKKNSVSATCKFESVMHLGLVWIRERENLYATIHPAVRHMAIHMMKRMAAHRGGGGSIKNGCMGGW